MSVMFDLTGMTGKGADAKRFTGLSFFGMPIGRRPLIGGVVGALVGTVLMLALWPIIDAFSVVVAVAAVTVGVWVMSSTSGETSSTTIYRYQQLAKQHQGGRQVGKFFLGSSEFTPMRSDLIVMHQSTRPVADPDGGRTVVDVHDILHQ